MPRGIVFEILDDYKRGDLDIGEAYDLIVNEIGTVAVRASSSSGRFSSRIKKPKRKLSAWNKFVKANSKKKIYQFASGKLKLKKMGIAFRKKKR